MRKVLFVPIVITILSSIACSTSSEYALREEAHIRQEALRRYPVDHPFPESEFMYVDGARLHVRRWEPDSRLYKSPKGVAFLVHGVSGSTYNWRFLAPALTDAGWRVLTADLPPFGFSGELQADGISFDPLPKDSPSRAALLWDLFDSVYGSYSGPVVLIGHSLGGRIAAFMALSKPGRAGKLVLLAPAVYGSSVIPSVTRYRPFNTVALNNAEGTAGNITVARTLLNRMYGERASDDDLIANWAPFLRPGVPDACADWAIRSIDTAPPAMSQISVPTLILWGSRDEIVFNLGLLLQREMQQAVYVDVPGGHCIMDTVPGIVTPAILDFL